MEKFTLKAFSEVEGKEQFCVKVSNRFVALDDLDAEVEINSAWEMIKTPWSESASELYRPSDRRLSAKRLATFADRGATWSA
jgi:hypothetical protein